RVAARGKSRQGDSRARFLLQAPPITRKSFRTDARARFGGLRFVVRPRGEDSVDAAKAPLRLALGLAYRQWRHWQSRRTSSGRGPLGARRERTCAARFFRRGPARLPRRRRDGEHTG